MADIRPSSTVILIRKKSQTQDREGFQMYVMKRPKTMKAFQGYTVFPGGLLEPQDVQPEWSQYFQHSLNIHPLLPKRMDYPDRIPPISQTDTVSELPYAVAAIREVFEETGILLCQTTSPQHPTLQTLRQALLNKEMTFLDVIKKLDICFNAEKLTYIGRRVTPPPTSVFFDANFYLSVVPEDTVSIPSEREIVSENWIEPSVALDLVEQKEMTCAPATVECFNVLNTLKDSVYCL